MNQENKKTREQQLSYITSKERGFYHVLIEYNEKKIFEFGEKNKLKHKTFKDILNHFFTNDIKFNEYNSITCFYSSEQGDFEITHTIEDKDYIVITVSDLIFDLTTFLNSCKETNKMKLDFFEPISETRIGYGFKLIT
jgi:hypothetical protein